MNYNMIKMIKKLLTMVYVQ